MKRSILVISNNDGICHTIEDNFMVSSNTVFCARKSTQAMEMIMLTIYSLIILDITIQDMKGAILLRIIHQLSNTPILVLTKMLEIEDRIRLLDLGADDCLSWPTNIDDLIVRVEACIKKGIRRGELKSVINRKIGLLIDPAKRYVEINGQEIALTRREFDIFYLLASNPGRVFSKEQIYAGIWEDKYIKDDSNIMSHIGRLRKKLGPESGRYIQTVWGIGYRFTDMEKNKNDTKALYIE